MEENPGMYKPASAYRGDRRWRLLISTYVFDDHQLGKDDKAGYSTDLPDTADAGPSGPSGTKVRPSGR